MTVLYDVLNRIPISAKLLRGRTSELRAAKEHLPELKEGDLILADRAYGSYQFFAEIFAQNANFLICCKEKTYENYHRLFSTDKKKERVVELKLPKSLSSSQSLPQTLKVRFIRIILSTGEVEILATSLLDKRRYPYKIFKILYFKRWHVETYLHPLKSHLALGNFTGKSVEAIRQDFYAILFVSGLETILTAEAEEKPRAKQVEHPQKVNKAISFHLIKNKVVKMIFEQEPDIENKIKELFLIYPTISRPNRTSTPRSLSHARYLARSVQFQRGARKYVF